MILKDKSNSFFGGYIAGDSVVMCMMMLSMHCVTSGRGIEPCFGLKINFWPHKTVVLLDISITDLVDFNSAFKTF